MAAARAVNDRVARLEQAESELFAALGVTPKVGWAEVPSLGARVRYFDIGEGDVTVCIHGSPNAAATWAQLPAAMPERRFILFERPGAGLSEPVTWTDHRRQAVAAVTAVLDQIGVEQVDLVASSFGGLYAYYVALDAPQRVKSLAQMGAPTATAHMGLPFVLRMISLPGAATFMRGGFKPTLEGARKGFRDIGHGASVDGGKIPEQFFAWYAALVAHGAILDGTTAEVRAIASPFGFRPGVVVTEADLAAIECPVLYVWGSADNFASVAQANRLAASTRNAPIHHFDGGHLPWMDEPERVGGWLREFYAGR